jgi:hypothetical protein
MSVRHQVNECSLRMGIAGIDGFQHDGATRRPAAHFARTDDERKNGGMICESSRRFGE